MASIYVYNVGSTSFSAQLIGLQTTNVNYTRKCQWTVSDSSSHSTLCIETEYITQGGTEGVAHTFTGLSSNTTYVVSCLVYRMNEDGTETYLDGFSEDITTSSSGGSGDDGGGDTVQTWGVYPTGNLGSVSAGSSESLMNLSFYAYCMHRYFVEFTEDGIGRVNIVNPAGQNDICCYVSTGMTYDSSSGIPNLIVADIRTSASTISLTFDATAYLPYYIWIREANGKSSTINFSLFVGLQALPTIAKWDWYSSNGDNADASQTISAYNAVNGTGIGRSTQNFPHEVWNDMVDKVGEIIEKVSGYWDTDYASYDETMSVADENGEYVLTAVMFNSLRNNLEIAGYYDQYCGLGYKTGIGAVNSGDTVYGDYFATLTDYMNYCIDVINDL